MKTLNEQFEIIKNEDAKRYEFNSVNNNSCSYVVEFCEVDNLADAKIAIYKGIKKDEARMKKAKDSFKDRVKENEKMCRDLSEMKRKGKQ